MKKILLLLSLVAFYFTNAQTPNYAWGRMFGNNLSNKFQKTRIWNENMVRLSLAFTICNV